MSFSITELKERFKESSEVSSFSRKAAEDCIRFARLAEQWPDDMAKLRGADGRPCLVINRLPAFIRQVVNDARMSKPSMITRPVDSGADPKTSTIFNGILRHIERHSNADIAYDTAIDHAVTSGFGFFRVDLDYAHCDSFDMELGIERISNPLNVYWDVSSTRYDAEDWEYAFIIDEWGEKEFKRRFGKKADVANFSADREPFIHSQVDDNVIIAECWTRTVKTRKLLLIKFADDVAQAIREDVLEERIAAGKIMEGSFEILRERDAEYGYVERRFMSGVDMAEENEWPGDTIPIMPVWGEEVFLDGRRHFRSMVTDAMDPQRQFNYWRSAATELIALAPKAPFIAPIGSIPPSYRHKWETSNTRSYALLEYDSSAGAMPQRQVFAGIPAGAVNQALQAADDMKAVIGQFDASLGAKGNETSGVAINARKQEGDVSNFHFIDNRNRAIRSLGKCLIKLIPHIYSGRETIRILGEDQQETIVKLNPNPGAGTILNDDGEPVMYDLSVGHYDLDVKSGPSLGTQREETQKILVEIMRAMPDAAASMADVFFQNLDIPGSEVLVERAKLAVEVQKATLMQQLAQLTAPPPPPQGMPMGPPGAQGPAGPPMGNGGMPPQGAPPMPPPGV